MRSIFLPLCAVLTSFVVLTVAQTSTNCQPLNGTCPPDNALGTNAFFNFSNSAIADSKIWNTTAGRIDYEQQGGAFTIHGQGDAPTIQSNFYIFFGRLSVVMKTAPGVGIVSSVVLLSDDLDEIDWEFIGGNTTHAETNYFSKGNQTAWQNANWFPVDDNQNKWHNYTVHWTADAITWIIDDKPVRTLNYSDADKGDSFPQTPCQIKIGNWAGGDPELNPNGTVQWAGGDVDYSKGPFSMMVQSVDVEDFSSGKTYTYGDKTGSWQSIKVEAGNSTIHDYITKPHGAKATFKSLPKAAQIAVVAGVAVVVAALVLFITICCIKSRRAGRREKAIADAEWEKSQMELRHYKRMMVSEEEIHPRAGYI